MGSMIESMIASSNRNMNTVMDSMMNFSMRNYVSTYITLPEHEVEKTILATLVDLCEILEKYEKVYVGKKYSLCTDLSFHLMSMIVLFRHEKERHTRLFNLVVFYDKAKPVFDKNIPNIFRKIKVIPDDWNVKQDKEKFTSLFGSIETELRKIVKLDELRLRLSPKEK